MVIGGEVYHGCSGAPVKWAICNGRKRFPDPWGSEYSDTEGGGVEKMSRKRSGMAITFLRKQKRDALCIRAIDEMADVLGRGIANICYVMNPEVVVLGGGVMAQEEYLRGRIEAALGKYLFRVLQSTIIKLAFAKHRNDAGMLGAYYHFRNMQKK